MAVTPPITGFNETMAAAVNTAAVRHCGDSGVYYDVSAGSTAYTCNIYLDRVTGAIGTEMGPEEGLPVAEIPSDQIPEPGHGDRIELLDLAYKVDGIGFDNGLWRLQLREADA